MWLGLSLRPLTCRVLFPFVFIFPFRVPFPFYSFGNFGGFVEFRRPPAPPLPPSASMGRSPPIPDDYIGPAAAPFFDKRKI